MEIHKIIFLTFITTFLIVMAILIIIETIRWNKILKNIIKEQDKKEETWNNILENYCKVTNEQKIEVDSVTNFITFLEERYYSPKKK